MFSHVTDTSLLIIESLAELKNGFQNCHLTSDASFSEKPKSCKQMTQAGDQFVEDKIIKLSEPANKTKSLYFGQ